MNVKEQYIGNSNLISKSEAEMAEMLKRKNLDHANEVAQRVVPKDTIYSRYVKRLFDIIISLTACILLLPFNLVFAVCTFLDVGRPIFYRQSRCGKDGKEFILVKFRNMNNKTDEKGQLLPAAQRITKFGHIMRKYSLDEFLNFVNVLKGDMSIIGPRPLPMFFYQRMNDRHKMRTCVRPGLECPRIFVPEDKNLCQYHIQFENDIWYVEHVSFITDAKMCFKLVKMVFDLRIRDRRAKGDAASYFVGYDEQGHALSMNTARQLYGENAQIKKDVLAC
ncbi:MAG: sugar transferase [Lachnospiraceae bacterium]|nr:sugar transferase [Lachnospiraceae bacterium]